jgi:hypothetical protein
VLPTEGARISVTLGSELISYSDDGFNHITTKKRPVLVPIRVLEELDAVCASPNDTPHDDIGLLDLKFLPEQSWMVSGGPSSRMLRTSSQ